MKPTSSASLDTRFRYRIGDAEVVIYSLSGNPQLLLGFDAQDFLAGTVDLRRRIHADDADVAAELFARQATSTLRVVNLRVRQASGRIRCVKCSYAKSATAAGFTLDLLLEDAKSLPRTLDDAPAMANFRAVMENADDYIFFKDRNHVLTGASQTLAALCDPAKHWTDLLGQTDYDLFPEEFADAYYKLEKQVFAQGEVAHEVQEYLSKEGRKGWVDNRKYPIRNAAGEIVGLYGIARDITEQRRIQAAVLSIADFVAQDHGDQAFDAITEFAVRLFNVDYVHIALLEPNQTEVRVVAARLDGQRLEPGYVYALSGTPCENVTRGSHRRYDDHVRQLFPADHDLVELQAEGYVGEPIIDNQGRVLGLIVLVRRQPLVDSDDIVSGLRILAARAAAHRTQLLDEQALRASEQLLRNVLDIAQEAIWDWHIPSGRVDHNARWYQSLSFQEGEIPATVEGFGELLHPDDRPQVQAQLEQLVRGEIDVYLSEHRMRDRHGRYRWVRDRGAVVERDHEGRPLRVVGSFFDNTPQYEAERALRQEREKLRLIVDHAPIGIWLQNGEGKLSFVNRAFCDAVGIPEQRFLAEPHYMELMPEAFRPGCLASDAEALATEGISISHEQLAFVDGKVHDLRVIKAVKRDACGQPMALVGLSLDITEELQREQALQASEEAQRTLIAALPDVIMRFDPDGRHLFVSENVHEVTGLAAAAFIGKTHRELGFPEALCAVWDSAIQQPFLSGRSHEIEFELDGPSGHAVFNWRLTPDADAQGRVHTVLAVARDITERKQTEEALRLAANVFTHAREGITITDRYARILDVNAAFTEITGYSREEVLGENPRILKSGRQDQVFYAAMWRDLLAKGHWYGEIWNRRKDGGVVAEMLTISAVRDERGEVQNFIALFSDITTIKEHQAQLEYIAHYDALTGLPNRLLLGDRLRQAMSQAPRRGQRLAVAYLDLDGFKAVNDTHGHEVGDQLLEALARRMTQVLRDGDTLGRLGGDEFVAVLVDLADIQASVPILTRLLETTAQPFPVGDVVLNLSASLGVTFYPQNDPVDADQLLRQADQAMYQAKQAGKNRYHAFDTEQDRHVRGRHESLASIRQALADGEFLLYYQPKINMHTGQLIGAEALIRWKHAQRGLLLPAAFLPVIENQPIAIDLGEWVIDTALTQIEAWRAGGLSIPVSVNVGALQLQHPDFVARLRTLLSRHPGVSPGELQLEVLETSALEDFSRVSQVMSCCRELGVGFALDDFGTGYSSLTYLKQLPTDLLKVDQSFVRDMLDDPDDLAILEGVLGLATAFRRQVIAEGVETLAHGEMLLRLGCEWAQGYAIARPMPAQQFPAWLSTWEVPATWKTLEPMSRDRLPALFAAVEHRAWICAVVNYLSGKRDTPPEQDAHQCRFGHWLEHGGAAMFFGEGVDHPVVALHREIHRVAAALMTLKRDGGADQLQTRISDLYLLRDQLLAQLGRLY